MRLSMVVPGAVYANVFLDGEQLKRCFAADDVLGIALVAVLDQGKTIDERLHRHWRPGEFEHEGVVVRWARGRVTFTFDPPEKCVLAYTKWQLFAHDALWTLGEFVAKGTH